MPNIYKINITLDDLVLAQASFALTPAMGNTKYLLRMWRTFVFSFNDLINDQLPDEVSEQLRQYAKTLPQNASAQ